MYASRRLLDGTGLRYLSYLGWKWIREIRNLSYPLHFHSNLDYQNHASSLHHPAFVIFTADRALGLPKQAPAFLRPGAGIGIELEIGDFPGPSPRDRGRDYLYDQPANPYVEQSILRYIIEHAQRMACSAIDKRVGCLPDPRRRRGRRGPGGRIPPFLFCRVRSVRSN